MKNNLKIAFTFFIFLLVYTNTLIAQELPPIQKFSPIDYNADSQNWMVSQGSDNFIYAANNKGLLEYNGHSWSVYPSPNNTIVRSVNAIKDKIYTGCYSDFGFWLKNDFGVLEYQSLASNLDSNLLIDEQIWDIIEYNEWVVFQARKHIYFYNTITKEFKIITSKNLIYKIFKIDNHIYYHVDNEGLYTVKDGKPKLLVNDPIALNDRVINIFESNKNILLLTRKSGFYIIEANKLTPWHIRAIDTLKNVSVFSAIQLSDKSFVLGTISKGILHLTKDGQIDYIINQKKGLSNNTVLSLFEDSNNNVWAGLDNGLDCINVTSPIRTFIDYDGVLGTVYATKVFNDHLYLGTNQGLFYRKLGSVNDSFKFIEGTAGQVWSLYNYNDEDLLCGHHLGTFLVNKDKAKQISDHFGVWNFKNVPNQENVLLQGNYDGIYVLEKVDNNWKLRNKIKGFNNSSRYFEINDSNQIWVNHEYKGVFELELNDSLTKVVKVVKEKKLPKGKNSSLTTYRGDILYMSNNGVFKYYDSLRAFKKDSTLSKVAMGNQYISGKMVVDLNKKLWVFSKESINFIDNDNLTNKVKIANIPIPSYFRRGALGFENIETIAQDLYILGTANGYLKLNLDNITYNEDYSVHLNSISNTDINQDTTTKILLKDSGDFNYKYGILTFNYSVPEYEKFLDVKYQFKLNGNIDKWSEWSNKAESSFENLPYGDYHFEVKAKVGSKVSNNIASYNFTINKPWYISNLAWFLYLLALITIALLTNSIYKNYYNKMLKNKELENKQTVMQIKNEKLNQDIENKNRELAISTMSIIKKNRVLNKIKKELKKSKDANNAEAIKLVESNLNDTKDWSFFEQAFNNADKDFLEKIKQVHPDLTPNDLRFCAYLRLNLSSKEMAPLLNISVKSVETKRYRLRKKLDLEHDSGLVNYILKF
ncbi:LuxR family transcriptional regulator [Algibacter amylolyticus]|uniref:LuxR family transcriptional regulator n=1 Tax=Algibacter amylolyticus TaxID=1608400 RepID=A0A5M7BFE3_9FLAO|nr:triple tyrosine motif-containing protein [Algibacter amylolyticus]KAA5827610.1 LuxR family transcriptional regulator [Algibacter amylolyticus]MBB5266821.1 DNA-binding CsgD family transcriptional regulator [Algibacter amylolyticus]TSJ81855.1 LuxR family transcriptional regulator [Algibacter amylolyticus]